MALRAGVAVLLGLLLPPLQGAEAQGSVQPVLGDGAPRSYRHPPLPYYRSTPHGYRSEAPYRFEEDRRPAPRSSTYRTLCVRLCDGYYFPISSAASQDTLVHDADVCSASCGSDARLFFHPSQGGDAASAVDLTGMAYTSLANAFKYRKTLVEDCRCRPQPWSQAEAERHRAYADGQSVDGAGGQSIGPRSAEVIAGDYSRRSVVPGLAGTFDDRAVARPDPIVRNIEPILPEASLLGAGDREAPRGPYAWPYGRRY